MNNNGPDTATREMEVFQKVSSRLKVFVENYKDQEFIFASLDGIHFSPLKLMPDGHYHVNMRPDNLTREVMSLVTIREVMTLHTS